MTDDELLAAVADPGEDPARLERISTEIDAGFRLLSDRLGKAVAVLGSARPGPGDPRYAVARTLGSRFAEAGFAVITGGGAGLIEAANRGAAESGGTSVGLGIELRANSHSMLMWTCR
jgi:predicted Rossmann-fold nucleotide-binding protein